MKSFLNQFSKCLCLFAMLLCCGAMYGQNNQTVYEQLEQLNEYWAEHQLELPLLEEVKSFESDRPLIALHLQLVEQHLRANPPSDLTEAQMKKRTAGLDILKDYWEAGSFPINNHHRVFTPYFVDDFNTACAVGHIMRESGEVALTARIASENNYAYIMDMDYPELGEWAFASGFTVEELRWIQPTYGPDVSTSHTKVEPNCGNNNGSIDVTVVYSSMNIEGYEWRLGTDLSAPVIATTEDLADAESGFYSLDFIGTGGWGYGFTDHISLSDAEGPSIAPTVINQPCSSPDSYGSISLNLTNPDAYEIKWYTYYGELIGENTDMVQVSGMSGFDIGFTTPPPYSYRVEVIDGNGCKTYQEFSITIENSAPYIPPSFMNTITPASCETGGAIDLGTIYSGSSDTEDYTVEWSNGATTEALTNLDAGDYTITVTNAFGCSSSKTITVPNACSNGVDCLDIGGTSFGTCGMYLGVALFNGVCVGFSGCDYIGNDGVDYEDHFFEDIEVCMEQCGGVVCPPLAPPCSIPVQIVEFDVNAGQSVTFNAEEELYPACLEPILAVYAENVINTYLTNYPAQGTIEITEDGNIIYTANPDAEEVDELTYRVCYDYSDPVVDPCFNPGFQGICTEQTIYFNIGEGNSNDCVDPSLIDPFAICITLYAPVCGCDGVTYSNECVAITAGGVTSYTQGECGTTDPCGDLSWIDDLNMEYHQLVEYSYNGEQVYLYEVCNPFLSDGLDILFDCNGNELCYRGGFAGFDFEDCPDFLEEAWPITMTLPCGYPQCTYTNPVTELPWIDSMLTAFSMLGAPNCGCYSSLTMVDFGGQTSFYLDSDCNFVDDNDIMYDCEGNIICLENGLSPGPTCGDFTEIATLWTCSEGIVYPGVNNLIDMDLSLKVFLQGPMTSNGIMNTNLSINGLLNEHPYNGVPYDYSGPALSGEIPDFAVDYILIELREDFGMPATAQQVAFLLQDGSIVMEDGSFPHFVIEASKTYQVWLRHHNHLDIVSSSEIAPANMVEKHFLSPDDAMGPEQLTEVAPGFFGMFAGDINQDGVINVTDYDEWFLSPAVLGQYLDADTNLDGVIQATDYDYWFANKAKIGYAQQLE